jgi:fructose-bisphosphate aldolase class II
MKFSLAVFLVASAHSVTNAFVSTSSPTRTTALLGGMSDELGVPCEEDCAIEKYPNLPESIHPGVLSGQAMMDLLNHAKENGA